MYPFPHLAPLEGPGPPEAGVGVAVCGGNEWVGVCVPVFGKDEKGGRERFPEGKGGTGAAGVIEAATSTAEVCSQGTGAAERGTGDGAVRGPVGEGSTPAVTVTMTWRGSFRVERAPVMNTSCNR